jgi:hypothetical protein
MMRDKNYEIDDDGTLAENVAALAELVVGHRIVSVKQVDFPGSKYFPDLTGLMITLDTGRIVELGPQSNCCAHTDLKSFLLNADKIGHVITGVSTSDEYEKWSIYADLGDVLSLEVGWSAGNGMYGYGFEIVVTGPEEGEK